MTLGLHKLHVRRHQLFGTSLFTHSIHRCHQFEIYRSLSAGYIMKLANLFVLCVFVITLVSSLTKQQEFEFIADYCQARNFKSVTLITSPFASNDFLPLFRELNKHGIRFAVENEVDFFYFSSFTLYIILHDIFIFADLLQKVKLIEIFKTCKFCSNFIARIRNHRKWKTLADAGQK